MEKTLKEKWAEKTSEILIEQKFKEVFKMPDNPTALMILVIIEAYEKAQRIVAKDEALELTQRFAHELPGVVDFSDKDD